MHRNTKLLVIILAVIAALVVGVNIGKSTGTQSTVPATTPTPIPTQKIPPYTSSRCGISLSYPGNLRISESSTSSTMFVDPTSPASLPVTLTCQPHIPGVPISPDKIESYVIESMASAATASAKLYHDTSAKDGTPIDKLIFTNPAKHLDVFISGYGDVYLKVISSLKLL